MRVYPKVMDWPPGVRTALHSATRCSCILFCESV